MNTIISWFTRGAMFGAIIMYGALGETLTQKSGNMNLGTPGTMCVGGACGFVGAYSYELYSADPKAWICVLIAIGGALAGGFLCGLLFSLLTVTLKANQNVTGLALTIFGSGLARFLGAYVIPDGTTTVKAAVTNKAFSSVFLPGAKSTGYFGQLFLSYGFMLYVAIIIALAMFFYFKKTRSGLNMRAVGENPATADAAGIKVNKYKYAATCIGCAISGLGGIYYIMDYNYGGWSSYAGTSIEALGWLSVALVIFASWKSLNLIWGGLVFGLLYWLYNYVSAFGWEVNSAVSSLLEAVPYVVTIIVLVAASMRKSKSSQGPASLGLTYFREDR